MTRAELEAAIRRYDDAAFVLAVAGLAYIWPPLALLGGAGYLIGRAVVADRRLPAEVEQ